MHLACRGSSAHCSSTGKPPQLLVGPHRSPEPLCLNLPTRTQPLKHVPKRVQSGAMTVCIAAQFQLTNPYTDDPTPAFVLCTDGRLSEAEWGSNDAAVKTHTLGYNYIALMAGHWATIRSLCLELEAHMQRGDKPKTRAEAFDTVKGCVTAFCASSLCPEKVIPSECLITGFIDKIPMIIWVRIDDKIPTVEIRFDYSAIGEGSLLAESIMKHRGYDVLNADLPTACYLVYEAKRFSESVDSVGPKTWLKIHAPVSKADEQDHRAYMTMDITAGGLGELDKWRKRFFLHSTAPLKGRLFRCFH